MDNSNTTDTQDPNAAQAANQSQTAAGTDPNASAGQATGANAPAASASTQAQTGAVAAPVAAASSTAAAQGNTLTPVATADQPALLMRVEVLKDIAGNFHVHPFAGGRDMPAFVLDNADQVRGAVTEMLDEHLAD